MIDFKKNRQNDLFRANNIGIKNVTTKYILFLNPDLNIDKETTKNLFEKIIIPLNMFKTL